MPLESVRNKTLQVSVWNFDRMQENEFLGAVTLKLEDMDLSKENIEWHKLSNYYTNW